VAEELGTTSPAACSDPSSAGIASTPTVTTDVPVGTATSVLYVGGGNSRVYALNAASMAKVFASEVAMEVALNAMRVHGGNGYSPEYDVERYFRDAPLMIVGEGTNEIQRNVIARQLIQRHKI